MNQVLATLKFTLAHDGLQRKYRPHPQELTDNPHPGHPPDPGEF